MILNYIINIIQEKLLIDCKCLFFKFLLLLYRLQINSFIWLTKYDFQLRYSVI